MYRFVPSLLGLLLVGCASRGSHEELRLTYELDTSKLTTSQWANINDISRKEFSRLAIRAAHEFGSSRARIRRNGPYGYVVTLSGDVDEEYAERVLGSNGKIGFYHAKNVVTPQNVRRLYKAITDEKAPMPNVRFVRTLDPQQKPIRYGNPDYKRIIDAWGDPVVAGDDIAYVYPEAVASGYEPLIEMSRTGSKKLEQWSRRYYRDQENLACVVDGRVIGLYPLQQDSILKDSMIIEGSFSPEWVQGFVEQFRTGPLPADLKLVEAERVSR